MRLPWPDPTEVEGCDPHSDTLKLLRWKNHLPDPDTDEERFVVEEINRKLGEANAEHVEVIATATGYAA